MSSPAGSVIIPTREQPDPPVDDIIEDVTLQSKMMMRITLLQNHMPTYYAAKAENFSLGQDILRVFFYHSPDQPCSLVSAPLIRIYILYQMYPTSDISLFEEVQTSVGKTPSSTSTFSTAPTPIEPYYHLPSHILNVGPNIRYFIQNP
jgi:hypothetical protein